MAELILVTGKEFTKGEAVFQAADAFDIQQAPTEEAALADAVLAARCRAVILGVEEYAGPLYDALGRTGSGRGAIIARFGVGTDGVDKELARQHNILVKNTPGVLDQSVAEHTIFLIGCTARRIPRLDAAVRNGNFEAHCGIEIREKTLGIIGFGAIGRQVAVMAHSGSKMRIIAADCRTLAELKKTEGLSGEEFKRKYGLDHYTNDIESVLRKADIVTSHEPVA